MAERWFPTYEKFSAAEKFGDIAALRRILDAIWGHLLDRHIITADHRRYASQIEESMPHMDDFDDAEAALAACVMLGEALDACGSPDKPRAAARTAISGFHAVIPDFDADPDEQPRLWRKAAAQNELKKQLKLIEQIDALSNFDDVAIAALRKASNSTAFIGKTSAPTKSTAPKGWTNQAAFEQYRVTITADLKQTPWELPPELRLCFLDTTFIMWGTRYRRRTDNIKAACVDTLSREALVARNIAHDVANKTVPMWDAKTREWIDRAYTHTFSDVKSVQQPHGYGPSLRRLWVEAKQLGQTDEEACTSIKAWARHIPSAWAIADQQKRKGRAQTNSALAEYLARPLAWSRSSDVDHPWETEVDGNKWRVRINDFPDDFMYTLLIGKDEIGPFHDRPNGKEVKPQ